MIDGMNLWQFRDMVSPVFFSLFPPRALLGEARNLFTNYRDRNRFGDARRASAGLLAQARLAIALAEIPDSPPAIDQLSPAQRKRRGEAVLQLYFAQLWDSQGLAMLDLSHRSFAGGAADSPLRWDPQPLYAAWQPAFRTAVRDLYRGFYRDDLAAFERGAKTLRVAAAGDVLLEHFAQRDEVAFSVRRFHDAFHDVFTRCAEGDRAPLPPDFLTFGLCLATLHQHLERLDVVLDVRRAYESIERQFGADACSLPRANPRA